MTIQLYKRDLDIEWDGRFFARDWEMITIENIKRAQ
jgi:hypothetical protein